MESRTDGADSPEVDDEIDFFLDSVLFLTSFSFKCLFLIGASLQRKVNFSTYYIYAHSHTPYLSLKGVYAPFKVR